MSSGATRSVIVGIDGSEQAENAAVFAVDEARRRGAALRLVYVIRNDLTGPLTAEEYRGALDIAKDALQSAEAAVDRIERPVQVRTSIAQGSPAGVLLAESADAEMICVGASGMGRVGRAMLGSTAATVAEEAACSVMIAPVPHTGTPDSDTSWVIVPVSEYNEHGSEVIEDAVAEARLRGWPMLAVGVWKHELGSTPYDAVDGIASAWQRSYPDVHVYPVATDSSLKHFLHTNPEIGGMVVVDAATAADVSAIVGSGHRLPQSAERAVLIARNRTDWAVAERDSARC